MASEYLKWLARNEKPAEKRELTRKEKWLNWWDYHKWHVFVGILALAIIAGFISDYLQARQNQPDYQVAFVGSATNLPEDTADALETAIAALGEDLNGDGQVLVRVNQYLVGLESVGYTGLVQLSLDLSDNQSFIFLMTDPEFVHTESGALAYPDGSLPAAEEPYSDELCYAWEDCPVLAALDLGEGGQEALSGLYVGRKFCESKRDFDHYEENEALWQKLTEGAKN